MFGVVLSVSALACLSCGSEEEDGVQEPLTVGRYAEEITRLQEESRSEFNSETALLGSSPSAQEYFQLLAQDYERAIHGGERFFSAVGALIPPGSLKNSHDAFVAAWLPYKAKLENWRNVWASAQTSADLDVLTPENEATARNPFEDACLNLAQAVKKEGYAPDFQCETDWFFGGGEVATGSGGCIRLVPEESASPESTCSDGSARPPGGRTRIAEMPPLPAGLTAVSYFYETVEQPADAGTVGVGLPILKPVSDPSMLGLYTYSNGKWERIAAVTIRDVGTITAEVTFEGAYPENYAVLQITP